MPSEAGTGTRAPAATQLLLAHLESAVREVFDLMVQAEPRLIDRLAGERHELLAECQMRAVVDLCGAIRGVVTVACDLRAAEGLARGLLQLPAGDPLETEDLRDALGEWANMVAGALKTRAFEAHDHVRISVPRVEDWAGEADGPRHWTLVFGLEGGGLEIAVWTCHGSA